VEIRGVGGPELVSCVERIDEYRHASSDSVSKTVQELVARRVLEIPARIISVDH
jgi:hypothetical protein